MAEKVVPLFRLNNKHAAVGFHALLDELLESEYWAFGPKTAEFEETFCEHFGHKHAIACANGTAAIQLVLAAYYAQEVFIADTTFVGVWNAVQNVRGMKHVRVVRAPDRYTWDVTTKDWLEALKKPSCKPRIVIVTHLYGSRSDVDIAALKALGDVIVIEDMSQCHGLSHSPFSDAQIYSMYPTKNVGALGEAGVITTDNPRLAETLKSNSFYGYYDKKTKVRAVGSNYKMDELQAAFVTYKLKIGMIRDELANRRVLAARYNAVLPDSQRGSAKMIRKAVFSDDATYHLYPVWARDRKAFRDFLNEFGIQTGCHYPDSIIKMISDLGLQWNTSGWNSHVVTLPIGGYHTLEEIDRVCEVIKDYENNY